MRKTASQLLRRARLAIIKLNRGQRLHQVAVNKITMMQTRPQRTKVLKALRTSGNVNEIQIGKSLMIS